MVEGRGPSLTHQLHVVQLEVVATIAPVRVHGDVENRRTSGEVKGDVRELAGVVWRPRVVGSYFARRPPVQVNSETNLIVPIPLSVR